MPKNQTMPNETKRKQNRFSQQLTWNLGKLNAKHFHKQFSAVGSILLELLRIWQRVALTFPENLLQIFVSPIFILFSWYGVALRLCVCVWVLNFVCQQKHLIA